MVETYLTWETRFLVPLVLAVAVLVYRRDEAEELRFLWIATGITLAVMAVNALLVSLNRLGLPASLIFLLLATAYAIHPSAKASLLAAAIGGAVACVVGFARLATAGLPLGLEEGRGVDLPTVIAAAVAGLATTVLVQARTRRTAGRASMESLLDEQTGSGSLH